MDSEMMKLYHMLLFAQMKKLAKDIFHQSQILPQNSHLLMPI